MGRMLIIPAQLKTNGALDDGGLRVTFLTNILSPDERAEIGRLLGEYGYLAFKQEDFTKGQVSVIDEMGGNIKLDAKSPSQRIKQMLWLLWKKDNCGFDNFDRFYEWRMNKYINQISKELDD